MMGLAGLLLAAVGLVVLTIGVFQQGALYLRKAENPNRPDSRTRTRLPRAVIIKIVLGLVLMVVGFLLASAR